MSSLMNSYRKLTDPTNQGIFTNEELLLSLGRVYRGGVIEQTFGDSAIIDFVFTAGTDLVAIGELVSISDSEEFKTELFLNPTYTGGTPIPLVNQLAGNARPALSSMVHAPSVTNDGIAGTVNIISGIAGRGNRSGLSEGAQETLTLIQPGIEILLRVTNQGSAGELDVQVRMGEVATTI